MTSVRPLTTPGPARSRHCCTIALVVVTIVLDVITDDYAAAGRTFGRAAAIAARCAATTPRADVDVLQSSARSVMSVRPRTFLGRV